MGPTLLRWDANLGVTGGCFPSGPALLGVHGNVRLALMLSADCGASGAAVLPEAG